MAKKNKSKSKDEEGKDETATPAVGVKNPYASPPRKAIKSSNLNDSSLKKSGKKTYIKVFRTQVPTLEAYFVEEFEGQDGYNWNLCEEINTKKEDMSIIDQGFFLWGDRRKSQERNDTVENRLPATNGVTYNRRIFFRCIPDLTMLASTKETRDEGLHVLLKVCFYFLTMLHVFVLANFHFIVFLVFHKCGEQ